MEELSALLKELQIRNAATAEEGGVFAGQVMSLLGPMCVLRAELAPQAPDQKVDDDSSVPPLTPVLRVIASVDSPASNRACVSSRSRPGVTWSRWAATSSRSRRSIASGCCEVLAWFNGCRNCTASAISGSEHASGVW